MSKNRKPVTALCAILLIAGPGSAAGADPLRLRAITVKSGFEKAEVQELEEEHPCWGKARLKAWSVRDDSGIVSRVVEIRLGAMAPRSLSGYLRRWRRSHGCTARGIRGLPTLGRRPLGPPQLTFEGHCEGGDTYILHVLLVGDTAYELHVDTTRREGPSSLEPKLRKAMLDLLLAVELTDPLALTGTALPFETGPAGRRGR